MSSNRQQLILLFLPAISNRVISNVVALLGAALVTYSMLAIHDDGSFPGINAAFACFGAALLIWRKEPTGVARALSLRPVVFIGLISYSLYLWHWPVLVLYRHYLNGAMPGPTATVGLIALSIVLSVLSWRAVERPFRTPIRWDMWRTVTSGLAASGFVAMLGYSVMMNGGVAGRVSAQVQQIASADVMWDWFCDVKEFPALDGFFCSFGPEWETATRRAVLWGDSHAEVLAPFLQRYADEEKVSFVVVDKCPAALGGYVRREWKEDPTYVSTCEKRRRLVLELVERDAAIDTLILAASWNPLATVV